MNTRMMKIISSLLLMAAAVSSFSFSAFADTGIAAVDDFDMADWYVKAEASSDKEARSRTTPTPIPTPTPVPSDTIQLTEEMIQEMNDDEAIIVYGDEGYVTTIVGRIYDTPVHTYDGLRLVINQLTDLLGLADDYEIEPVYQQTLDGHLLFTFRQKDGIFEVADSTLKILIDRDNIPIMIQSSLVPNLSTSYSGTEITAEEAEEVVCDIADSQGITLRIFSEYTSQCVLNDAQISATRCYRIYSDNPFVSDGTDMPYLIHYVDFDGNYLKNYPTNNLVEETLEDHDNDAYFENLVTSDCTFTVTKNGEDFTFTVPVSRNSQNGKYYLADPSRKIILADFYSLIYQGQLTFETSVTENAWDDNHLITYYNYIQAYDYFYNIYGFQSTDSFGIPILVLTNWCDSNRNPINNLCSLGVINGWSAFASSDANNYGCCLDVIAHEYAHAMSSFGRQGNIYYNESGAINEAFSDIMGNLAEMYMGETDDLTWALGEQSGCAFRSMSEPTLYNQPLAVGDPYYANTVALPDSGASGISDNGGVHTNSSLISHLAYVLYENGVTIPRLGKYFGYTMFCHTPKADYDDLYAIFVLTARICGYEDYIPFVTEYFEEARLFGDRQETVLNTSVDDYARYNLTITPVEYAFCVVLLAQDIDTGDKYFSAASTDGTFSICIPSDARYVIGIRVFSDSSFTTLEGDLFYLEDSDSGWTSDRSQVEEIVPVSGTINNLPDIDIE